MEPSAATADPPVDSGVRQTLIHTGPPRSSKGGGGPTPGGPPRGQGWRKPAVPGAVGGAAAGSPSPPVYRAVVVGGVPLATAQANLRRLLETFDREPQFVMVPLFRVAVEGEVNRPSMYVLSPQTTISEAVARAGGPTQFGRLDRVRLLRRSEEHTSELQSRLHLVC